MAKKESEGLSFSDDADDMSDKEPKISFNFDDTPDAHTLLEGEAKLRITSSELKTKESSGNTYYSLRLEPVDDPFAKDILHTLMLEREDLGVKENWQRKTALKEFFGALPDFDASVSFQASALIGEECWALLSVKYDDEYGEQNKIRRFVVSA